MGLMENVEISDFSSNGVLANQNKIIEKMLEDTKSQCNP